jgi:hypothetical protein
MFPWGRDSSRGGEARQHPRKVETAGCAKIVSKSISERGDIFVLTLVGEKKRRERRA